jgi:hypothetical protein
MAHVKEIEKSCVAKNKIASIYIGKKPTNRNDENKNIVNPDLYKRNAIVLCTAAYRLYGRKNACISTRQWRLA